jgi:uncharacterized protein (TIGR02588 family)
MAKPAKNWLEWTVFAVGLVLVLATLGYLVRESLVRGNGPPDVEVVLGAPQPSQNGFLVPVEVVNRGQSTAEDVLVPVYLEVPGGEREEAQLSVAFLPADSRRQGWVSFRSDPASGSLRVGAVGFEIP